MTEMGDISEQIEVLKTTGTAQLLARHKELLGDKVAPGNRVFLIRQLANRIQEQAMGGISPAARDKIRELIQTYDPINKIAIKTKSWKTVAGRDGRLPMPGSFIIKIYKGNRIEVKVLENGFEYQGAIYKNHRFPPRFENSETNDCARLAWNQLAETRGQFRDEWWILGGILGSEISLTYGRKCFFKKA